MDKLDARTLALYLGCSVQTFALGDVDCFSTLDGIDTEGFIYLSDKRILRCDEIKPILRELSSMTEKEMKKIDITDKEYMLANYENGNELLLTPSQFQYLLSEHFDLFGLIEKGLAIKQ